MLTLFLAFVVHISFAQDRTISGTVSDESGPLPGVNIVKKGTSVGTETDFYGKYSIKAKTGDILIFSFVGSKTIEKTVGSSNTLNATMTSDNVLDEVVVTALGIEKKKDEDLSSSTTVKTEVLTKSGETGLIQGLAGKTSGLKITRNTGDPGSGAFIQIRGQNSINGASQPLIIIDGIPVSNSSVGSGTAGVAQQSRLNDINAEDIANVTVLKGASAAAVWGTGAANGVIVIQTKKGKAGKVSVNVKSQISIDEINVEFEKQNKFGQGVPDWWNGGTDYSSTAASWVANTPFSWGDKISLRSGAPNAVTVGNNRFVSSTTGNIHYPITSKNDRTVYNDSNRNQVFGNGLTVNNSVGVSFSSGKSNTFVSFSNLDQNGIIKGQSSYERNTIRLNHEVELKENFKLRFNTSYINIDSDRIQQGSNLQGLYLGYLRTAPDFDNTDYIGTYYNTNNVPTFNSHRSYRNYLGSAPPTYGNPGWTINEQENPNKVERFTVAPQITWEFIDNYTLTARYGLDYFTDHRETFFPVNSPAGLGIGSFGQTDIFEKFQTYNAFIQTNQDLTDDINLDVIVGATFEQFKQRRFLAGSTNFSNPIVGDVRILTNSAVADRTLGTLITETAKYGYYGVLNATLYDQFLVELSGRYDKSSTLKEGNFYPSASLGWKFSKLLDDSSFINFGKVRVSYGEVGIEPSPYLNATTFDPGGAVSTWGDGFAAAAYGNPFTRNGLKGNPDLTIEKVREYEVGTDLRMWDNRINLGVTYYNRKNTDVILNLNSAPSTGFTQTVQNAAVITNKGLEIDLGATIIRNENLTWKIDANFSQNKNVVEDLKGVESVFLAGFTGTSSRVVEGHAMATLWGGRFARDNNGAYVLDSNGFPTIAATEGVIGDPNPDWIGGLGTTVQYKGFTLSAQFETSQGNDHWTGTEGVLKFFGIHPETANETTAPADLRTFDGRTIPAGTTFRGNIGNFGGNDVALTEEWYLANGGGFGSQSETFVQDASWTRLREVTLAYSFPKSVTDQLGVSNLELSLSGRNLVLWTGIEGFDPDINLTGPSRGRGLDYFTNPATRSYIATLKFGF
ncbi:membrane protein [Tenacibaculum holothuriorum]|uniref:Membrane protein n=1 Tax=Tenacibaculum holothuriorum TaxID=1635173 RepID=A0A1Y2PDT9_9FLAO|nr:membrane protein [Tenacibaculum holothuriorum]